jgi:NADPH2:quinone reductase
MLFHYIHNRAALEAMAQETFDALEQGVIRAQIGLRVPLSAAREAHIALEARETAGSVILQP